MLKDVCLVPKIRIDPDSINRIGMPGFIRAALAEEIAGKAFSKIDTGECRRIEMKTNNKSKMMIMTPYMEQSGRFVRLEEYDGVLLAEIAKHVVVLPIELKNALTPLLGQRIAILRTDIPGKGYLVRVLTDNKPEEREDQCGICETVNRGQKPSFVAMLTQKEAA